MIHEINKIIILSFRKTTKNKFKRNKAITKVIHKVKLQHLNKIEKFVLKFTGYFTNSTIFQHNQLTMHFCSRKNQVYKMCRLVIRENYHSRIF